MKNKTKYIEIIGSSRIIFGILVLIAFSLSVYIILSPPSLVGIGIQIFVGLPFICFCYVVILVDFIRLSKNKILKSTEKTQIRFFLSIILIIASLIVISSLYIKPWVVG